MADPTDQRTEIRIDRGGLADLDAITALFQGYLAFYEAPGDHSDARAFLSERLTRGESIVFLARVDGAAAGLAQIYPTFSSVSRAPVWTLNDLYVDAEFRRFGIGRALIRAVAEQARKAGAIRVELSTDETNRSAQALYEDEGFVTGQPVRHYTKDLG
ncbi:GNAT family N-acetyltransferase [Actinoplanes sp. NPDC024001]|uniref:GNAT family N-acetyltransferase n=1 Tax=Actinoplanes sp. NPDC024001 TaxID=3154598 RepID=UPI0033E08E31